MTAAPSHELGAVVALASGSLPYAVVKIFSDGTLDLAGIGPKGELVTANSIPAAAVVGTTARWPALLSVPA